MIAARNSEKTIGAGELNDLVLGDGPESLHTPSELLFPYLPGPLEGAVNRRSYLSDELTEIIEQKLDTEEVEPSSFIALVNTAILFGADFGQAKLAAKALRLANYRLRNLEDQSQLLATLNGLATVAAIARSLELADELRILVRRYRHDPQCCVSIENAIPICMVATASRNDLLEWREFAGEWLTECAFDELESEEVEVLYSQLQSLLHAVPELWTSCAKAEAALKAFNCLESK